MSEAQLPFPNLLNCSVGGERCALAGCWYDAMIAKINANNNLDVKEKEEIIEKFKQEAGEGSCKKYSNK